MPDFCAKSTPYADPTLRCESDRLIALLARRVGPARIDLVEDAVQDALAAATRN